MLSSEPQIFKTLKGESIRLYIITTLFVVSQAWTKWFCGARLLKSHYRLREVNFSFNCSMALKGSSPDTLTALTYIH